VIFTDLRHYVSTLEKLGQLQVIEGASCELEIGAITEMATSRANSPAVLFDSIQGHAKGFRMLTNFLAHKTRERLVYGVDENLSDSEAVKYWKNKLKTVAPMDPTEVAGGPVKENVMPLAALASTGRWTVYLRHRGGDARSRLRLYQRRFVPLHAAWQKQDRRSYRLRPSWRCDP